MFLHPSKNIFYWSYIRGVTRPLNHINIDIFTYGGGKDEYWSRIYPDPDMVAEIEAKLGKYIPDMALYHCHNTHYDLLFKDDSRLAVLGFVAGSVEEEHIEKVDEVRKEDNNSWVKVHHKKDKITEKATEILLEHTENEDENDIQEEMVLLFNGLCLSLYVVVFSTCCANT